MIGGALRTTYFGESTTRNIFLTTINFALKFSASIKNMISFDKASIYKIIEHIYRYIIDEKFKIRTLCNKRLTLRSCLQHEIT